MCEGLRKGKKLYIGYRLNINGDGVVYKDIIYDPFAY